MFNLKVIAVATSLAAFAIPAGAIAQNAGSSSQSQSSKAANSPAVTALMQAAQRLRDATHDLVQESDVQQRSQAISKIDKTLSEIQAAIVSLPSNVLLAGVREGDSKKAASEMARAADRLNAAAAKLGNSNSGNTRQSVEDIQKALAQVRQERTKIDNANTSAHVAAH
jgi:cob(I)alamin adenosyltransferase